MSRTEARPLFKRLPFTIHCLTPSDADAATQRPRDLDDPEPVTIHRLTPPAQQKLAHRLQSGRVEGDVRVVRFHRVCRPRAAWLSATLLLLFGLAGCQGRPVVDLGSKPAESDGTISGSVRGPDGTSAISGRTVEVVNVDTGESQRGTTSVTGGFTFKVKPGKYRVDLALHDGEILVKKPDVIHVNRSDVDAHADFVLGATRVSRPRTRMPRSDDGLGAGIA